jgi:hypothetical protein
VRLLGKEGDEYIWWTGGPCRHTAAAADVAFFFHPEYMYLVFEINFKRAIKYLKN